MDTAKRLAKCDMKKLEYIKDLFLVVVFSIAYGAKTIFYALWELIKTPFTKSK